MTQPDAAELTLSDPSVAFEPRARRGRGSGLASIAAALALATALVGIPTMSAQAAPSSRHFIQISTREAPRWKAEAFLYNRAGKLVYSWENDKHWAIGGGKDTWRYDASSDGGYIIVDVTGRNGQSDHSVVQRTFNGKDFYLDHCFHINPVGEVSYTGDSATGGCTDS